MNGDTGRRSNIYGARQTGRQEYTHSDDEEIKVTEKEKSRDELLLKLDNLNHTLCELNLEFDQYNQELVSLNIHGLSTNQELKQLSSFNEQLEIKKIQMLELEKRIESYTSNENKLINLAAEIKQTEQNFTENMEKSQTELAKNSEIICKICKKLEVDEKKAREILEINITSLVSEVTKFDADFTQNNLQITEINNRLLILAPQLDSTSENAFEELSTNLEITNQNLGEIQTKIENVVKISSNIQNLFKNNEMKLVEYQNINKINLMINGKNRPYISFERYILSAYFKQIVRFGNIRLQKMTNNRYQFNVNSEFKTGQSSQGLDLTIIDFYTGKERDITSLSGGESFKASISLALGLSDVVRFENGGIELNSLFIDEGFGTLDPESLDQAIEVIMELEADGRMVGIISHVGELKDMIKQQIQIESTKSGSTLKIKI